MIRLTAASAPGKLMVSGEYAVLEGAVAVVASVNVRAYARWCEPADRSPRQDSSSRQIAALPPEVVLARELAEKQVGSVKADLSIDVSDLRRSDKKLGLGSSAAASAAAVGAVLASHGQDLSQPAVQRQVLELALAGHKAVAPEGSGADVAAASLGGFVRFRVEGSALAEAERMAWPVGLATRVVWTGKEARTSDFVRKVRALENTDPSGYGKLREALREQAERFAAAIEHADLTDVVAAAGAYGLQMGRLGEAAGVAIVTSELARIAALAHEHGGAAKPSGAGGGDVAIAFFAREDDARAFDAACRAQGLDLLDLRLGGSGVRAEAA